jgi:hypothetical protein
MSGLAVVIFVTTPLSYLSQQIAARLRRKLAHLSRKSTPEWKSPGN